MKKKINAIVKERGCHDDVAIYINCQPRNGGGRQEEIELAPVTGGGFYSPKYGSCATFVVDGVAASDVYYGHRH